MLTLEDMLQEMQSFVEVDTTTMEKASRSVVTQDNSTELNNLILEWQEGAYDEDPELMVQALERLL